MNPWSGIIRRQMPIAGLMSNSFFLDHIAVLREMLFFFSSVVFFFFPDENEVATKKKKKLGIHDIKRCLGKLANPIRRRCW